MKVPVNGAASELMIKEAGDAECDATGDAISTLARHQKILLNSLIEHFLFFDAIR